MFTSWYCPWMGVVTDKTTAVDARAEARAWLIAHGSTDAEVSAMYTDYPYDVQLSYVDGAEGEYSGFCQDTYPGSYPVWVVELPQGYYIANPSVIRE